MATLTFNPTLKDRLFYDKYLYSLTFRLKFAGFLRGRSHESIEHQVNWHNLHSAKRWSGPITVQDRQNLHNFLDHLANLSYHKLVLTHEHVYLYTNNVEDVQRTHALPYASNCWATVATINRPRDTVLLKDPQYQYRTFFKERFMTKENMATLSKFLLSRQDCFRTTDELRRKLKKGNSFYTCSHYFVDHNNREDLVLLQIVCPGIVRKTLTIQAK